MPTPTNAVLFKQLFIVMPRCSVTRKCDHKFLQLCSAGTYIVVAEEDYVAVQAAGIRCVVLGSPAVMSEPLAELCRPFVTVVILRCDIVPRWGDVPDTH